MNRRGGARRGAGRKTIFELGKQERHDLIKEIKAEVARNGTTVGQEVGKMISGVGSDKRLKLAAIQLYLRDILPRVSEREVTHNEIKVPQIYLPEQLPDTDEAPDYLPRSQ